MEKDKDIIEVIIDEQPTNNKKIKFAYWDNLAKDLSPLFIKVSSAVCIMIVLGVFFVGFFIPKNDNKNNKNNLKNYKIQIRNILRHKTIIHRFPMK